MISLFVLVVFSAISVGYGLVAGAPPPEPETRFTVTLDRGTALVRAADTEEDQPLTASQTIEPGMIVTTGGDGAAAFDASGVARVYLDHDTVARVLAASTDPFVPADTTLVLALEKGRVFVLWHRIGEAATIAVESLDGRISAAPGAESAAFVAREKNATSIIPIEGDPLRIARAAVSDGVRRGISERDATPYSEVTLRAGAPTFRTAHPRSWFDASYRDRFADLALATATRGAGNGDDAAHRSAASAGPLPPWPAYWISRAGEKIRLALISSVHERANVRSRILLRRRAAALLAEQSGSKLRARIAAHALATELRALDTETKRLDEGSRAILERRFVTLRAADDYFWRSRLGLPATLPSSTPPDAVELLLIPPAPLPPAAVTSTAPSTLPELPSPTTSTPP